MWISNQTICRRETIRIIDRRKLQSIWIRTNDRGKRRQKDTLDTENLHPICLRITRVLSVLAEYVDIQQRIPCHLPRVPRVQSHPVGNDTADATTNRQQIGNEVFSKNHPPTLWNACDYELQFRFRIMHVAEWQNIAADFLSRLEQTPK